MGNSADHVTVNLDNFVLHDSFLNTRQIRYQRNYPITEYIDRLPLMFNKLLDNE